MAGDYLTREFSCKSFLECFRYTVRQRPELDITARWLDGGLSEVYFYNEYTLINKFKRETLSEGNEANYVAQSTKYCPHNE